MPFIPNPPTVTTGFNAPTLQQTASNIKVRIPDDCVTCGHQMFVGYSLTVRITIQTH